MRAQLNYPGLGLLAVLMAGCVHDPVPIEFSDASPLVPARQTAVSAREVGLKKADLAQMELAVFSYLLTHRFSDDAHFSAVFVAAEESQTTALIKKFPRHVPPIKPWWHLDQRPGFSPQDLDTGRAALVLSADVADPENGKVVALGKWFAGDALAGFFTFEFQRAGDGWAIQSVR